MHLNNEFHPICRLCGKWITWGQPMIEVQHMNGSGEHFEYEHEKYEDCE